MLCRDTDSHPIDGDWITIRTIIIKERIRGAPNCLSKNLPYVQSEFLFAWHQTERENLGAKRRCCLRTRPLICIQPALAAYLPATHTRLGMARCLRANVWWAWLQTSCCWISNLLLLTKYLDLFGRRCGICWHNIIIWSIVYPHLKKNIKNC